MSSERVRNRQFAISLALLAIGLGAVGCGGAENTLSGSVGEIYDLSFERVQARQYNSEFSIEYVRTDGQVPVRVVVERGEGEPSVSTGAINLDRRGTIIGRVDERQLPDFDSGTLRLESFRNADGATVSGSFDSELRVQDTTYTLKGAFGTTLEVVDRSLGYRFRDAGDASEIGVNGSDGSSRPTDGGDS